MKSDSSQVRWDSKIRNALLICLFLCTVGCATMPAGLKFEPPSFADKLDLHGCWISIPLSPSKVIADSKRGGNPDPEGDSEWISMVADLQNGDQLRLVNCAGVKGMGDELYYALIRNNAVIHKYHPMILD